MQKLVDICDPRNVGRFELRVGGHKSPEAGMCAMEFVAYLAGEEHSDAPQCTCPVIAAFVRRYNDFASPGERQKLLPLLPQLIGTRGGAEMAQRRAYRFVDAAVRAWVPRALRMCGLEKHAHHLEALDAVVDGHTARCAYAAVAAARAAAVVATDAAYAAAAATAAARAAADAAYAAANAANAAADAAATAAAAIVPTEKVHSIVLELADMYREAPLEFRPAPARRFESLEKQIAEVVG